MTKNMEYNFDNLHSRVIDTLDNTDLERIRRELYQIKDNVICTGNGGSSVVSQFASQVLNYINHCVTINIDPRDLEFMYLTNFKNLLTCTYSGKNYGVETSFENDLNKHILSNGLVDRKDVKNLTYNTSLPRERSFISLGATLMPMSVLLSYYLHGTEKGCSNDNEVKSLIERIFDTKKQKQETENIDFDVLSGFDTSVAAKFIESTFIEAALGNVVIHSKYDFCHGRTTLPFQRKKRTLIFLKTSFTSGLGELELELAKELYDEIIVLESKFNDLIVDNYVLTLKAMYLAKNIAERQSKDLSKITYFPKVNSLYNFKGRM